MDSTAVFKLSYGVFFLGTEFEGESNACVVNTVLQVTQVPLTVSVTVLKTNLTHDMMLKSNKFSVSIMGENVSMDLVNHFGGQSGKTVDKLANMPHEVDILGNPLIKSGCIATLTCKVINTIDMNTHTIFIAEICDSQNICDDEPLTYNNYRKMKGGAKMSENTKVDVYECTVCHYVYDGDIPFEELPEDYVCPICGEPKSAFVKI